MGFYRHVFKKCSKYNISFFVTPFVLLARMSVKLRCVISRLLMPWQVNVWIVTQLVSMLAKVHSYIFCLLVDYWMSTVISWMGAFPVDSEFDYA